MALLNAGWKSDGIEFAIFVVQNILKETSDFKSDRRVFARNIVDLEFLDKEYNPILGIGCFHGLPDDEKNQSK
ncbi:MAG: hypothetical protein Q7J07_03815 [Pelolinea sp.]|nr:hypothetical protein [Pelolinea sp.]